MKGHPSIASGDSPGTPAAGVGLLLAAGAGRRYGMPKILAADGAWLRKATDALLGGGCESVFVVLGAATPLLPAGCHGVHNPRWRLGMATSLSAGLEACADVEAAAWAAIHVVDVPDVDEAVVRRVVADGRATGMARAVFRGMPGHPVVLARRFWTPAAEAARGDSGARDFLRAHPQMVTTECGDLADGRDHDFS